MSRCKRALRTACYALCLLTFSTASHAASSYIATMLGEGSWIDINGLGNAVGNVEIAGAINPVIWRRGALEILQVPDPFRGAEAARINDQGAVLGNYQNWGLLWDADGVLSELVRPTFARFHILEPRDLNNIGQSVAQMTNMTFGGATNGLWVETDFERELYGTVRAINDAGSSVGSRRFSFQGQLPSVAYLESSTGAITIIGSPDAPGVISQFNSQAFDINNSGVVLINRTHLWDSGVFTELDGLFAYQLNDANQVVGDANFCASDFNGDLVCRRAPAVWEDGVVVDLTDAITEIGPYEWATAIDVNNSGQILIQASINGGRMAGVLLTPVPNPPGLYLLPACLIFIWSTATKRRAANEKMKVGSLFLVDAFGAHPFSISSKPLFAATSPPAHFLNRVRCPCSRAKI